MYEYKHSEFSEKSLEPISVNFYFYLLVSSNERGYTEVVRQVESFINNINTNGWYRWYHHRMYNRDDVLYYRNLGSA